MSLLLFEGAAGTGKTMRLLEAGQAHLAAHGLKAEQRVLALTKFHGSRRRMEARLKGRSGLGLFVDCLTIDSFAWSLVQRWRGLLQDLGAMATQGDFQGITRAAGLLLRERSVSAWVSRRYPLLIVDEMQDCKGGEVEILAGLVPHVHCLCAADGFQDLSGDKSNEAITWASSVGEVRRLDRVYRTTAGGLLSVARALRDGVAIRESNGSGFRIRQAPKAPVAGAIASWCIQSWLRSGQIAIISPTRPGTSTFVDGMLTWMSEHKAQSSKNSATAGPFSVSWEAGDDEQRRRLEKELHLEGDPAALLVCAEIAERARRLGALDVRDWLLKQRDVAGRHSVPVGEVCEKIGHLVQRRRAFSRVREDRYFALTVHQAKNREFDQVVALWPLRMQSEPERQRRLLYNAITRAKRQVLLVVEDPKGNRLEAPPFIDS